MKLFFFEPPPAQKTGGLDAAIASVRGALAGLGHDVAVNEPLSHAPGSVAHFHGLWQRGFPALSRECMRRGIPFVVSPHGMLEPWAWRHKWWKKWPYFQFIERRWMARASCLLATSRPEADRLREFFPGTRVESLPLGLTGTTRPDYAAARSALGWSPSETVLLYLSRIHEKKGLDLLLGALADLKGRYPPDTRLVIVGPEEQPSFAAKCLEFARDNASSLPRIDWIGPVWGEERWRFFQGADLFCLPTHSENFGLAVLEACQVGTPALTTTGTPWAALLADDHGLIATPDTSSIRQQLAVFFSRPRGTAADRAALADWAWQNFDWNVLGPRYAAMYKGLN